MPTRILVIEDNPESRELIIYLLSAFGYVVFSASNGREGLETIRRERPDMILCDLHVPELSGYEVARQVRLDPQFRRLPMVAVTASAMPSDRAEVLAAGFDGYITKPIVPEEFVGQVESFLKRNSSGPHSSAAPNV